MTQTSTLKCFGKCFQWKVFQQPLVQIWYKKHLFFIVIVFVLNTQFHPSLIISNNTRYLLIWTMDKLYLTRWNLRLHYKTFYTRSCCCIIFSAFKFWISWIQINWTLSKKLNSNFSFKMFRQLFSMESISATTVEDLI